MDNKTYYYIEKIIDTECCDFTNYIITEDRCIVDESHLNDVILDMFMEKLKVGDTLFYYPFATDDEAEGVRIYEIDKDGSLHHVFTTTGAYSDDREQYVITFSNHHNQWLFTEYDESEDAYHSMIDMKKLA